MTRHRLLVAEAALCLLAARLLVRVLPFRYLGRVLERTPPRRTVSTHDRDRLLREIRCAVGSAARRLPGQSVCLPRAVAAQAMLRRRGLATTVVFGAAVVPDEGLSTHAWLQCGAQRVLGGDIAGRYRVVARFPAGVDVE